MTRLFALLVLMLTPFPAVAQSDTGTRLGGHPAQLPDRGTMSDVARARIWLEGYAKCVAKRDPKRVESVLSAPLNASDAGLRNLSEGSYDSCLSGGSDLAELRMSPAMLRGALYVEQVSRTVHSLPPTTIALHPLSISADVADTPRGVTVRFGDCVMRQQPEPALSYVRAGATLGMESNALALLRPALAACINSGEKVELSRASIKVALAEAIYRTLRTPIVAKSDAN